MGVRNGGRAHAIRMRAKGTEEEMTFSRSGRNFCLTAGGGI
jgi:hypothetical protein